MKVEVRGKGRPLVYLHPAGGVRWTDFLSEISRSNAVHVPTFPGFDGSAIDPQLNSTKALGASVGHYIDKEIGKPCDVIGCSFGGAVALWLAIERPECVAHLVLESPAGLQSIDPALRRNPLLAHYGAEDGNDPQLLQNISRIEAVTLILHGTEDRIIGKESVQLLKSRLKRAFLVYVWDAAHNIELDQPGRMLALVKSFLERSDAFMVNQVVDSAHGQEQGR
jgi:pimeloyl-ACP methyl ester carboxylesterase